MNVKKAIKKIVALGAGATMVGATILGAMAYDLSDYPAPFVVDGSNRAAIVIGEKAKTEDVLGAIDIAASLQRAAKTPVTVSGSSGGVSVSGGVVMESNGNKFNWGDHLYDVKYAGKIKSTDLPTLLADGKVRDTTGDKGGTEYDYEQYVIVDNQSSAQVAFGAPFNDDTLFPDPVLYLDTSSNELLTFVVHFKDALNITALDDSEKITMFGKEYTFKNVGASDEIVLYGSGTQVDLAKGEPQKVTVDGTEYTLEVLGGNSNNQQARLKVTGPSGSDTQTVSGGITYTFLGVDFLVDSVFVSDLDGTVSVSVFVGSQELHLPAASSSPSWTTVTNGQGDAIDGVEAWVHASNDNGDVDYIKIRVTPSDMTNSEWDNTWDGITSDYTFVDPIFGWKVNFEGIDPSLDASSRTTVKLERNGDDLKLTFTNEDGDEGSITVYTGSSSSSSLSWYDKFENDTTIARGHYFILNEGTAPGIVTKVYKLESVSSSNNEFTVRDVFRKTSTKYSSGDAIGDSGVTGTVVSNSQINLSSAASTTIYAIGNLKIELGTPASGSAVIHFHEDYNGNLRSEVTPAEFNVTVGPDSDDDMTIGSLSIASGRGATAYDSDNSYEYGITNWGTYIKLESKNDGESMVVSYPDEESYYNVVVGGPSVTVASTGGSSGNAYVINPISVGLGVLDKDAASLLNSQPLIVVGGPCVNTIAAELMGNPANCAEGFTEGKAMIKYFDSETALLVAGYSAQDTRGAAYVLANYEDYGLSGTEVEVITTNLQNLQVNALG